MRGYWGSIRWLSIPLLLLILSLPACAASPGQPVLKVGGIPDQNASKLARRYQDFADYLSNELGVSVQYVPSVDYAAVVTAFTQGELHLAFFGGLTGVQARLQTPGAQAIAQRENDARFHSKLIARTGLDITTLSELEAQAGGLTLTFGSESSTSGHLMPRYALNQAGIDPSKDFKSLPNFSGSHDMTWQLVASGSFDVGALNEDVWNLAVNEGRVDSSKVREFYTTPAYYDYNWTVRPDLDQVFREGFSGDLKRALLALTPQDHGDILELFSTTRFIESNNSNYRGIEEVARNLGVVR